MLEWLFTQLQPQKTIERKLETLAELIMKGRTRILQITGSEPGIIRIPIKRENLEWCLRQSEDLQMSLLSTANDITIDSIKAPVLQWVSQNTWIMPSKRSERPLSDAVTVFTDAGKRSRTAAITWLQDNQWYHHILAAVPGDSLQTLELAAVVWAALQWHDTELNFVTDSLYVAGVLERIEDARIKDIKNSRLFELFRQLQSALRQRQKSYAVIHIRSHMWKEGLGEGNDKADQLVTVTVSMNDFVKAKETHNVFHQNARGLYKQFSITIEEARGIVRACPECSHHGPGLGTGVNPRGLGPNELWQMDVTHVSEFGRLKYVHVTVDTFSRFIWATAQAGEKALHVVRHLTSSFAVMGVPQKLKTDNGPAYAGEKIRKFCQQWGVTHITGIPHSPTGQAIVERVNQTLKEYLQKFKDVCDVQEKLAKTLFVMNYLCIFGENDEPPVKVHSGVATLEQKQPMKVYYRDLATGEWKGPVEVQYMGKGYMCVITSTGPQWVPSRWTKAAPAPATVRPSCSTESSSGTGSDKRLDSVGE